MKYPMPGSLVPTPTHFEVVHVATLEKLTEDKIEVVILKFEFTHDGELDPHDIAQVELHAHDVLDGGGTEADWNHVASLAESNELNDVGELLGTTAWGGWFLNRVWRGRHSQL